MISPPLRFSDLFSDSSHLCCFIFSCHQTFDFHISFDYLLQHQFQSHPLSSIFAISVLWSIYVTNGYWPFPLYSSSKVCPGIVYVDCDMCLPGTSFALQAINLHSSCIHCLQIHSTDPHLRLEFLLLFVKHIFSYPNYICCPGGRRAA